VILSPASAANLDLTGFDFVDVTPDPVFPGLNGPNQRMFAAVKVLGGVLVLRRIAAIYLSAGQAQPQVDPGVAHLHAFLTDPRAGVLKFDLIQMRTFARHSYLPVNG
jgi:hypothetical protein